jgi:hypothetical protein
MAKKTNTVKKTVIKKSENQKIDYLESLLIQERLLIAKLNKS